MKPRQGHAQPRAAGSFLVNGERMSVRQMAARSGLNFMTLYSRIYKSGMSPEEAMSTPLRCVDPQVKAAAREAGVSVLFIQRRMKEGGFSLEQARDTPYGARKKVDPDSIIGTTQGLLTATGVHYDRGWIVDCQCACGNKHSAKINRFTSGANKSCGCLRWRRGPQESRAKKYKLSDGRKLTIGQLSEISGVNHNTVQSRIQHGQTPDEAIAPTRPPAQNMVGQKFGRLLITAHVGKKKVEWICSCGRRGTSNRGNVLCGESRSCGCGMKRDLAGTTTPNGLMVLRLAPESRYDSSMKGKGVRGMTFWICRCPLCGEEFKASRYGLSNFKSCGCDRPGKRKYVVFGAPMTINELAELSGTSSAAIARRISKGLTAEEAAFTPETVLRSIGVSRSKRRKRFRVGEESLTSTEIAERAGISETLFWSRIHRQGLTAEQVIAMGPAGSSGRRYRRRP